MRTNSADAKYISPVVSQGQINIFSQNQEVFFRVFLKLELLALRDSRSHAPSARGQPRQPGKFFRETPCHSPANRVATSYYALVDWTSGIAGPEGVFA
jgi:hypothetical protein